MRRRATIAVPVKAADTGLWSFVVDVGVDPATGRRKQVHRRGFKTRREADLELVRVRSAAQRGGRLLDEMRTNGQRADEKGSRQVSHGATPSLKDLGVSRSELTTTTTTTI
jgi:hypothetical protein